MIVERVFMFIHRNEEFCFQFLLQKSLHKAPFTIKRCLRLLTTKTVKFLETKENVRFSDLLHSLLQHDNHFNIDFLFGPVLKASASLEELVREHNITIVAKEVLNGDSEDEDQKSPIRTLQVKIAYA